MNRIRNIVAPSLVQSAFGFLCEVGSSPAHDRWTRVVLNVDAQSELKLSALRQGLFRTETRSARACKPPRVPLVTTRAEHERN